MQIDLAGQVNAIRLGQNRALLPLFEAVVNAVQAIEERVERGELAVGDGLVEITIHRELITFQGSDDDPTSLPEILGFEVVDNGVGFTERHFLSFDTSYSTLKAARGGKGVGRLVWLKAFDRASIESVYEENGEWHRRAFQFMMTPRGIEDLQLATLTPGEAPAQPRTIIRLHDFKNPFRDGAPKGIESIAKRIVEHCLVMYMLSSMPRVVLKDPSRVRMLDLGHVYKSEIGHSAGERTFFVEGFEFTIMDVLLRASAEPDNAIHFCANKREVEEIKLSGLVAHAENAITVNGVDLRYAACVTGEYLDRRVNQQRTGFDIDPDEASLRLSDSAIAMSQVRSAALAAAETFLAPRLVEAKRKAVSRVEKFIEAEEPRYRILLEHRRTEVEKLSGTLTDDSLEIALHRVLTDWRHDVKKQVARRLRATPDDPESFAQFERESVKSIQQLAEVAKADLADYVLHRRMVLDFLQKMLGLVEQKKFAREDVLHGLFFPMRTSSERVDYDAHNLWVLDERLAYHKFLSSDVAFNKQTNAPVQVDSQDRPDLLIYNHPIAFSQDVEARGSVVIVEFKRPERDDYTDDDNPIVQVLQYIEQINAGGARRPDGSAIQPPPSGTPFYCHVIATLTPKLRSVLRRGSFIEAPDRYGFFMFNPNYNAYIEVADYRKVLDDAVKRNKIFFDKLGLHTGSRRPAS
jgi:hypothetical protein